MSWWPKRYRPDVEGCRTCRTCGWRTCTPCDGLASAIADSPHCAVRPGRLAGWAMAGGAALVATVLLWPAPARNRLRGAAAAACRALAARLRAGVAYLLSGMDEQFGLDRDHAAAQSDQAVGALRSTFLAMPYRPTGLSTPARTTVRLVAELAWLNSIVTQPGLHRDGVHRAPDDLDRRSP